MMRRDHKKDQGKKTKMTTSDAHACFVPIEIVGYSYINLSVPCPPSFMPLLPLNLTNTFTLGPTDHLRRSEHKD